MSLLKATGIISDHIGTSPVAGIGMGGLTLGSLGSFGPMGMGSMGMGSMGMGSMGMGPMGIGSMNMPMGPGGMNMPMGSGVSMGMGPLGFGAIRPMGTGMGMGSLGGLTPVSFSKRGNSVLHPAGMPIATTLNPFNPYDPNSTIVTRPFGGLSGMSGLDFGSFGGVSGLGLGLAGAQIEKIYNSNGVNVAIRGCDSDVNSIIKCLDDHLYMSKSSGVKTSPSVKPAPLTVDELTKRISDLTPDEMAALLAKLEPIVRTRTAKSVGPTPTGPVFPAFPPVPPVAPVAPFAPK